MDPIWFLDVFKKVDEAVSILDKYKCKLKGDYDTAYLKLDEALDEIDKMVESILEQLKKFMYLETDDRIREELEKDLFDFEVNSMGKRIEKSRGHCHKVDNIYGKYLDGFFSTRLNTDELKEMRHAFLMLSNMDGYLYTAIEQISEDLSQKAEGVKEMLDDKEISIEQIKKKHKSYRNELLHAYKALSGTMEKIFKVRNWFIQVGKIT